MDQYHSTTMCLINGPTIIVHGSYTWQLKNNSLIHYVDNLLKPIKRNIVCD